MTPLLLPVCPVATSGARSSTTAERSGRRLASSRATANPRIPPQTTARSHSPGEAPTSARLLLRHPAREQLEVGVDHQPDHLLEARPRLPAELLARLRIVAYQVLHLGRTQESRIDPHVPLGVEPDGGGAMSDLSGDELEPAAGGVVHDDATNAGAEGPTLCLEVEAPFRSLGRLADAANLCGVLAEVLPRGAHPHCRGKIERVVGAPRALLHIDRGRLVEPVVHPAQALREHGAVGLN